MRFPRPLVLSVLAALWLGACTAADVKPPATAFHEATKAAQASLDGYVKTLDEAALEQNIAFVLGNRSTLRPTVGDCGTTVARCRLVIRPRGEAERPLVPEPIAPKIRGLMRQVVGYAGSLEAIAKADVEAEVKAATDKTRANAVSLGKAIDALAKATGKSDPGLEKSIGAFGEPVANTFLYVAGQYVNKLKIDALRRATAATSPAFEPLPDIAGALAAQALSVSQTKAYDEYNAADEAYNKNDASRTRANLTKLWAAAEALDAASQVDPKAVFTALTDAHDGLTEALKSPELNFKPLWGQLQVLTAEASKLKDLAKAFQKAEEEAAGDGSAAAAGNQ